MKLAKPLVFKQSFYEPIEKEINAIFYNKIYLPIIEVLKKSEINNSSNEVAEALRKGKIFYSQGYFFGKFTSKLSKQIREYGAIFDARKKAYKLPIGMLPPEISSAIALSDLKFKAAQHEIIRQLELFNPDEIVTPAITETYTKVIDKMEDEFQSAVKQISVAPDFSPYVRKDIAKQYSQNLDLYIKRFSQENILKLREDIETNAYSGGRAENMVKSIQANYGVSKRKAKFLAKQETKLLMTQIHLSKAEEIGLTKYKWSTSNDERVRHSHKVLQGKIIDLANPPIVDPETGRRAHAGCDFGCRCVKIFIID